MRIPILQGIPVDTLPYLKLCNAIIALLLSGGIACAQVGPGGVTAGAQFWTKADQGVTTVGSINVSRWVNQSATGAANDAIQNSNPIRPDLIPVLRNYRPALYFNGNDDNLGIANLIAASSTQLSIFAVGTNESGGDTRHSMVTGQCVGSWTGGGYGLCAFDGASTTFGFWVRDYLSNRVQSNWQNQPMAILEGQYGAGSLSYYQSSRLIGSAAFAGQVGSAGTTTIGGGPDVSYNHLGHIAEVIIYNTQLNFNDRRRVNSYLGLKYGMTIDRTGTTGTYVGSNGTAVFTDGGVPTYWNGILGIARDDNSAFIQRQSQQPDDSTRIFINALAASNATNVGSFSANNQFVVMGHNGIAPCFRNDAATTKPVGIAARIGRAWKTVNTAFNGTFSIDVQLSTCGLPGTYATTDLRLLVDDDGDFSNATAFAPGGGLTITLTGGYVRISGISNTHLALNATRYLSIGTTTFTLPPGPGGVSPGNALWVKADQGVTLQGNNASIWVDQSGNGNDATAAQGSDRPSFVPVRDNYNPTLNFDGNNDVLNMNDLIAPGNTEMTVFAIGTNETGGDPWPVMVLGQSNNSWTGGGYGLTAMNGANSVFGYWVRDYLLNQAATPWIDQPAAILEGEYGSGTMEYYQNSALLATDVFSGSVGDAGTSHIGGGPGGVSNMKGDISEVIVYRNKLNTIDRRRVNSYLGVKYGRTLDRNGVIGNYVNSSGSSIFSDGGISTYWNGVIGIGRDDNSVMIQRQSKEMDDSTRIYISTLAASNALNTGTFTLNDQFVVIGHNTAPSCMRDDGAISRPAIIQGRIGRVWKTTNTNFNGTFAMDIQLANCGSFGTYANANLRLLVDDDGDFSNAQVFAPGGGLSITVVGGRILVSGISNTHVPASSMRYISIGTTLFATPPAPGGVYYGKQFWTKANAGVVLTTGVVSQWTDQSTMGNNATQATALARPGLVLTRENYNPTLRFNGTDHYLSMNDLIAAGSKEVTVFAVGTHESGGDPWHSMVFGQASTTRSNGGYGLTSMNPSNSSFGFWVRDYLLNNGTSAWIDQPTAILEGECGGGSLEYYQNSQLKATNLFSGAVGDNGTTHIGGGPLGVDSHKGDIAEVVIYSKKLSTADRQKVNSYLAIKYGITLERTGVNGNYLNSSGNSIYSDEGSSMYWNGIIGIGRDDKSALVQRQSRQVDDSTRVYIGTLAASNSNNTSNFTGDQQFIVIGNNKDKLCATPSSDLEKPDPVFSRLAREWKVTNTAFTGTWTVAIKLNNCASLTMLGPSDLRLLVDNDGNFSDASYYGVSNGLTITVNAGMVTVAGIPTTIIPTNATRYITIASMSPATPLPITLISFDATVNDKVVDLTWVTASEMNNDHFMIQRSTDLGQWQDVVQVDGAGTSQQTLHYSAVDHYPLPNISYYRLAQVDMDGTANYSQAVPVNFGNKDLNFVLVPNPANDLVQLRFNSFLEMKPQIQVIDVMGRSMPVSMVTWSDMGVTLNVAELNEGTYTVVIYLNGRAMQQRLVVQR